MLIWLNLKFPSQTTEKNLAAGLEKQGFHRDNGSRGRLLRKELFHDWLQRDFKIKVCPRGRDCFFQARLSYVVKPAAGEGDIAVRADQYGAFARTAPLPKFQRGSKAKTETKDELDPARHKLRFETPSPLQPLKILFSLFYFFVFSRFRKAQKFSLFLYGGNVIQRLSIQTDNIPAVYSCIIACEIFQNEPLDTHKRREAAFPPRK